MMFAAIACAACSARLMKLPSGPAAPAPDGAEAVEYATAACQAVSALTAEIGVSGSVDGQRLRGRLLAGVAAPASARLEAVAPAGAPLFIFVASGDDATVLLPKEDRVLEHGRPAAVLAAVAGVPLDAAELKAVLTGCSHTPDRATGRTLGDDWRVVSDGLNELYLHRDGQNHPWQLVATVHRGASTLSGQGADGDWRAEYRDFQAGLPRSVRLASLDGKRFDLRLTLSQVALNEPLGPDVFRVEIPRSAERITLDDLRHARPGVREN